MRDLEITAPASKYSANDLVEIAPWTIQDTSGLAPWAVEDISPSCKADGSLTPKRTREMPIFRGNNINNRTSESDPIVKLLVGKQDPKSPYFTPRIFAIRKSALQHTTLLSEYKPPGETGIIANSRLVQLPELDPAAFELYYEYLRKGKLKLSKRTGLDTTTPNNWAWKSCWPLLNAHILSTEIGDLKFGKYILSLLEHLLAHSQLAGSTVEHLFETPGASHELRNFVTDLIITHSKCNFNRPYVEYFPALFVYTALGRSIRMLRLASSPSAKYTPHAIDVGSAKSLSENLYKYITTQESLAQRHKTEDEGIDCIDWEERAKNPTKVGSASEVGQCRSMLLNPSTTTDKR